MVCKTIKPTPDEGLNNGLDNCAYNYWLIDDNFLFLINGPLYRWHNRTDYLHRKVLKGRVQQVIDPPKDDKVLCSVIQQEQVCPEGILLRVNRPSPLRIEIPWREMEVHSTHP